MSSLRTIEWLADGQDGLAPGHIRLVDQTRLPGELVYIETRDVKEVWHAINRI